MLCILSEMAMENTSLHFASRELKRCYNFWRSETVNTFLLCFRGHVRPCYLQAEWLFMYSCWRQGNYPALWKSRKRQENISDVCSLVLLLFAEFCCICSNITLICNIYAPCVLRWCWEKFFYHDRSSFLPRMSFTYLYFIRCTLSFDLWCMLLYSFFVSGDFGCFVTTLLYFY